MAGKTCRSSLCFPFRFANYLFLLRMINKTMPATAIMPPVIVNELLPTSPLKKNMALRERDRIPSISSHTLAAILLLAEGTAGFGA